jgi:hypothetical protein
MIYTDKSELRIVSIATNHNLIKRKFSLGKIYNMYIIYLGNRYLFNYENKLIYNFKIFVFLLINLNHILGNPTEIS